MHNRVGTSLKHGVEGLFKFELDRAFWASAFRVIGANMGSKRLVALQLKVLHHFIERLTRGWSGRFEPPGAFRASKTAKTVFFEPYELAWHTPVKSGF